ncbi:MAG: hypothetical protein AAFY71_00280 [Bacteroidota bacterium]
MKDNKQDKPSFWTSEKLLSLAALFTSVCTLIVFSYQTALIRKQQYTSVLPYLEMGHYYSYSINYCYKIKNNGIGPAILKKVEITNKEGKVFEDLVDYLAYEIEKVKDTVHINYSNLRVGQLIPENSEIDIIKFNGTNQKEATKLRSYFKLEKVEIVYEYESVYGERWRIRNGEKVPEKLK